MYTYVRMKRRKYLQCTITYYEQFIWSTYCFTVEETKDDVLETILTMLSLSVIDKV